MRDIAIFLLGVFAGLIKMALATGVFSTDISAGAVKKHIFDVGNPSFMEEKSG